ncbi:hypothetical protein P7C73_g5580, partial [Tremellales sp. Uapishka_1]
MGEPQPKEAREVIEVDPDNGSPADGQDLSLDHEDGDNGVDRIAEAKARHHADLEKHKWEPPKAGRVQDDWQVAYTWAFIVKFDQMDKIRKLECLDDFEKCLLEPVANRPDDIFEGILCRFLLNLRPGLRNLDGTNIQAHLSNYITDMLMGSQEFTVWDRLWAPNEEARGGCCNSSSERKELGRLRYSGEPLQARAAKNPIKQIEEKGGGLFELDWRERSKLLRQLVDWQRGCLNVSFPMILAELAWSVSHAEAIRNIVNTEFKVGISNAKRAPADLAENSILTEPLGNDRDKNRIWAFDASGRIYKSGNPYKRPCPLYSLTSSRADLETLVQKYDEFGAQVVPKLKGSGPKGKATSQETNQRRKLLKGIEEEKKLAEKLREELLPSVEKEEQ